MIIKNCNGCSIQIAPLPIHYRTLLEFTSYMKDGNTGGVEEVTNMHRQSYGVLCPNCYDTFLQHFEEFLEKSCTDSIACGGTCYTQLSELPTYHHLNFAFTPYVEGKPQEATNTSINLCDDCFDSFVIMINKFLEASCVPE